MPKRNWIKLNKERVVRLEYEKENLKNISLVATVSENGRDMVKIQHGKDSWIRLSLTDWMLAFQELYPDQITYIADDSTMEEDE